MIIYNMRNTTRKGRFQQVGLTERKRCIRHSDLEDENYNFLFLRTATVSNSIKAVQSQIPRQDVDCSINRSIRATITTTALMLKRE